jgi:Mg-chelatase subunit ChlD
VRGAGARGAVAAALAAHAVAATVIDCERASLRLGRCAPLAAELGADCLHVDALVAPASARTTSAAPAPRR